MTRPEETAGPSLGKMMLWSIGPIAVIIGIVGFLNTPMMIARRPAAVAAQTPAPAHLVGCREHIETHGSAFWARELGHSEAQVQARHRINLWDSPGESRRRIVGTLRVGSRAVVLERSGDAYRVRSPLDASDGWVSGDQVARTLRQDVESRQPCD